MDEGPVAQRTPHETIIAQLCSGQGHRQNMLVKVFINVTSFSPNQLFPNTSNQRRWWSTPYFMINCNKFIFKILTSA